MTDYEERVNYLKRHHMMKGNSRKLAGIASIFVSLAFFAGIGAADASELAGDNVISLINQSRGEAGVSALAKNAKLTQAAAAKADDMFKRQYFAHVGPDGNGPSYWADRAGYGWSALGENIAYGYDTAELVHGAFMNSEGHRRNILSARYEHVGVAAVGGAYQGRSLMMVVEEFGASNDPAEDAAAAAPETAPAAAPGKDKEPRLYYLRVGSGSGDGWYAAGTQVSIAADAAASGKTFRKWIGRTAGIADASASSTTFVMPSRNVSLAARYGSVRTAKQNAGTKTRASARNITAFLRCR